MQFRDEAFGGFIPRKGLHLNPGGFGHIRSANVEDLGRSGQMKELSAPVSD